MRKTELPNCPQWLLDARTEYEDVVVEDGILVWRAGNFLGGNFRGGDFLGGNFRGGNFRGGNFRGGDFLGGNFRGGNFRGGNFWGGDFLGEKITRKPISIYGLARPVLIVQTHLRIGCQTHPHAEWEKFSDDEISQMAEGALAFWKENKDFLLSICKHEREAR